MRIVPASAPASTAASTPAYCSRRRSSSRRSDATYTRPITSPSRRTGRTTRNSSPAKADHGASSDRRASGARTIGRAPVAPSRSNLANTCPSGSRTAATMTCGLTASAESVSPAALESPNESAAVVFDPTTSASRLTSRDSRPWASRLSNAMRTLPATVAATVPSTTVAIISFLASGRREKRRRSVFEHLNPSQSWRASALVR